MADPNFILGYQSGYPDGQSGKPDLYPPAPPTPTVTVMAGRAYSVIGDGAVADYDFGDPTSTHNKLRGYNAAHVYDHAGTYTATVTPTNGAPATKTTVVVTADTRPIHQLLPTDNLAAIVGATHVPTILALPAGTTYDVQSTLALVVNGVEIRGLGTPTNPSRIRRIPSPHSYAAIGLITDSQTISNVEVDSNSVYVPGSNAKTGVNGITCAGTNGLLRNVTFRNVDDAAHVTAAAKNTVILDCNSTVELRACPSYMESTTGVALLGFTFRGSAAEPGPRTVGAHYVLVADCDLTNHNGKESLTFRKGDHQAAWNNTIRQWSRISEGVPNAISYVYWGHNTYVGAIPGNGWCVNFPNSSNVLIDANIFPWVAHETLVTIQGPVVGMILTNNVVTLPTPPPTPNPPLVTGYGSPVFTETGTIYKQ